MPIKIPIKKTIQNRINQYKEALLGPLNSPLYFTGDGVSLSLTELPCLKPLNPNNYGNFARKRLSKFYPAELREAALEKLLTTNPHSFIAHTQYNAALADNDNYHRYNLVDLLIEYILVTESMI